MGNMKDTTFFRHIVPSFMIIVGMLSPLPPPAFARAAPLDPQSCSEPSDLELQRRYLELLIKPEVHESFYMVQPAEALTYDKVILPEVGSGAPVRLPAAAANQSSSSSPYCRWSYRKLQMSGVFPRTMVEAHPEPPMNCVVGSARCSCRQVTVVSRVLKRQAGCDDRGVFRYEPAWVRLRMGMAG